MTTWAQLVYILCFLTSALCAALLIRGYVRSRTRILLWSAICFVFLALNNLLAVVDLEAVEEFNRRVYDIAREIPAGETTTYGEIATRLGDLQLSRAVGQALGQNPVPIIVPCHRVLGADRKRGGFSAPGGVNTKLKILSIERAHIGGTRDLFDLV